MSYAKRNQRTNRWADIKGGNAFVIPVQLIRHENYRLISPWAHKLIADLSTQFTGFNNGYLCAAWTLLRERGWKSRTTLAKACAELEHYGLIERTQQGGRNRPNLYAFTWRRIDRNEGRPLDVVATTKPSDAWDATASPFRYSPSPRSGLVAQRQAHLVGSVCPPSGLGSQDKSTGWASSASKNTLPCPSGGHLTIVTSSTGIPRPQSDDAEAASVATESMRRRHESGGRRDE